MQRGDACLSGALSGSTRSSGALQGWAVAMADGPVLALWPTRAVSGGWVPTELSPAPQSNLSPLVKELFPKPSMQREMESPQ